MAARGLETYAGSASLAGILFVASALFTASQPDSRPGPGSDARDASTTASLINSSATNNRGLVGQLVDSSDLISQAQVASSASPRSTTTFCDWSGQPEADVSVIRGCFLSPNGRPRPFVDATFELPTMGKRIDMALLVDTGADVTVIGPNDASRLGVDFESLPRGAMVNGIGGLIESRRLETRLTLNNFVTALQVIVLEPSNHGPSLPSVLGRDILANFALVLEERRGRVLLVDQRSTDLLTRLN